MQNTYQDLITEIQNKNPGISPKLEGGKKFKITTDYKPAGDQPEAIKQLINGANFVELSLVLLGVIGSVNTFTLAIVIEITNGKCVPVVYDGVGKSTFENSVKCLETRGMMISFGNASGALDPINVPKMLQPKGLFFVRPSMGQYLSLSLIHI